MAPDIIPAQPASLHGLSLEDIAKLDTTDEVLARLVPESTLPVAAFQSAI